MIERRGDRRKGRATFCGGMADRRRQRYERRGTVRPAPPQTLGQQLYGERRQYQESGTE